MANAEGDAIESLPGCTANTFPANDDDSVPNVPLGFSIDFGGTTTHDQPQQQRQHHLQSTRSRHTRPLTSRPPAKAIIAPYLADVDTRGEGSRPDHLRQRRMNGGTKYFCVDWVNVGYFDEHADKLNSFQLVHHPDALLKRAGDNFTMTFNYDKIQWETGDAATAPKASAGRPRPSATPTASKAATCRPARLRVRLLRGRQPGDRADLPEPANAGGQPGRLVFHYSFAALTPPNDGTLEGEVRLPRKRAGRRPAHPIQICPAGRGTCVLRTTNSARRLPRGTAAREPTT